MTSSYGEIVERLEKLTGPDREMDARIWAHFFKVRYIGHNMAYAAYGASNPLTQVEFTTPPKRTRCVTGSPQYPHATPVTASLDAAVALVEKMLLGWGWRVATCCVSDDAWVFPDFNSPEHGERLRREFREDINWVALTDVDLRPPGRPAIALLISMFRALTVNENG